MFTQLPYLLTCSLVDTDKKVSKVPFPNQPPHSEFLQHGAASSSDFGFEQSKDGFRMPPRPGVERGTDSLHVLSKNLG